MVGGELHVLQGDTWPRGTFAYTSQDPWKKAKTKTEVIKGICRRSESEVDRLQRLGLRNISVRDWAKNREDRSSEQIRNSQFVIREHSYQMMTMMTSRARKVL